MLNEEQRLFAIGNRVVQEREVNKECKWCGTKFTNEPKGVNTCFLCSSKPTNELWAIFENSIEIKKKQNPHWWSKISETTKLGKKIQKFEEEWKKHSNSP